MRHSCHCIIGVVIVIGTVLSVMGQCTVLFDNQSKNKSAFFVNLTLVIPPNCVITLIG